MHKDRIFFPTIVLPQLLLLLLFVIPSLLMAMDDSSLEAKVHIVYTEKSEPELHYIRTLTSVLGSEDAAKGAFVYSYKHAATGFSAKLTPEQVSLLSKQPGVVQVVPSQARNMHSGSTTMDVLNNY